MKKLEEFGHKCESQDDKINHVIQFCDQLVEKDHYAKEKIKEKANAIKDRYVVFCWYPHLKPDF